MLVDLTSCPPPSQLAATERGVVLGYALALLDRDDPQAEEFFATHPAWDDLARRMQGSGDVSLTPEGHPLTDKRVELTDDGGWAYVRAGEPA